MSDLYRTYRNRMKAAKTYAELDKVERDAFHSYIFGPLSHAEYSAIYSLGTSLINTQGWH